MKIEPEGIVRNRFFRHRNERLLELKERAVPGTVDAVLFGGNFLDADKEHEKEPNYPRVDFEKIYSDSIHLTAEEVKRVFGFTPDVIAGPKVLKGVDDGIYDNKDRRLFIRREKMSGESSRSFHPE